MNRPGSYSRPATPNPLGRPMPFMATGQRVLYPERTTITVDGAPPVHCARLAIYKGPGQGRSTQLGGGEQKVNTRACVRVYNVDWCHAKKGGGKARADNG